MAFGVNGRALNSYSTDVSSSQYNDGVPTSKVFIQTVSGTSTYVFTPSRPVRVIGVRGVMSGAGGAGDTITVQNSAGTAISAVIDVSAMADKEVFVSASIDDAVSSIARDAGGFKVVTASGAVAFVEIELLNLAGSGQSGF